MLDSLFINLLMALVFGAAIGLERESSKQPDTHAGGVGGIRTFAIISLLGAVAGMLAVHNYQAMAIGLVAGFLALVVAAYISEAVSSKDYGITSELSAVATFFIGMLVMVEIVPLHVTVALLVMFVFVLSMKARTVQLMAGIQRSEVQAFISYAIIALVALPVLPDVSYKLRDLPMLHDIMGGMGVQLGEFDNLDLINPRKIWLVVVLITGIDVFGYILSRIVGSSSGFALTSFMAGFVSSTSATQSLALRSKEVKFVSHLVGAAVLANLASFLQIFLLIGPLNPQWLVSIAPSILFMVVTAGVIAYVFLKKQEPKTEAELEEKKAVKIFAIGPALKFAGLLIVIKIATKVCLILFGQSGFIVSSVIASFAGIDAIMVNLAEMAGHTITFEFAFLTFMIVNLTNLLSKSGYSYMQGDRRFAVKFLVSVLIVAAAGASWLFFI
jgi:uncharacterized membrane protein (DUF4010 family)